MSKTYKGSCFCGAVTFEVTGEPRLMGYCHCRDCASWAGAPINAFSLWAPEAVQVTGGADRLGSFAKTEQSHRKFCTTCGGHVFSEHPGMGMTDVYLNNVQGFDHKGTMHVFYAERTMDMNDDLPKFDGLPG